MRIRNALLGAAAAALLTPGLLAQGANDCNSAQAISGLGVFNFSNVGATIDGPFDCQGQPVRKDVWFLWTAPANNGYRVSLCGGTSLNTRLAIYDGNDCVNYPLIACISDNCNGQSRLSFAAVAGNQYLIRMGSRQVGQSGSGTFEITTDSCPITPDDSFEDNDDCPSAAAVGDGTYTGLFVSKQDADYYALNVVDGGTLAIDVLFTHANGDIDMFLFDGCSGVNVATGGSGSDNENIQWTNDLGCDRTVYLRVEHWLPDVAADCNNYDMVIAGTGGAGGDSCGDPTTVFCDPANPNSTGAPVTLSASGSFDASAGGSPVHLEATGGPNNLAGYFLISTGGSNSLNISDGILCLDSPQGRYNPAAGGNLNSLGVFDSSGVLQNIAGTSTTGTGFDVPLNLPNPPGGSIVSGSTWYFQVWYRDLNPQSVSNFSNGLAVTFN